MNAYLEIVLRTLLAVAVLLLLARLDGPKQISQLTFYDYIVGITAGSIAATLCIDRDVNIWFCLIGMVLFMLSSFLISLFTSKSIIARRLLTGSPIFLIDDGKILYDGLKRSHFDVNDLLRELRAMGYFSPDQVLYAILETNGTVSVMPKAADRPATAAEQNIPLPEDSLPANVIIDGKLLHANIAAMGQTDEWILSELDRQGAVCKNIALATLTDQAELSVYYKEKSPSKRTILQ